MAQDARAHRHALIVVCPATGHQVETDIDLDPQSFAGLPRDLR